VGKKDGTLWIGTQGILRDMSQHLTPATLLVTTATTVVAVVIATSNIWNHSGFEPATMILPGLHPSQFQTSEKLSFERVEGLRVATPSFVKDKTWVHDERS
jgi:hypothetical protein